MEGLSCHGYVTFNILFCFLNSRSAVIIPSIQTMRVSPTCIRQESVEAIAKEYRVATVPTRPESLPVCS